MLTEFLELRVEQMWTEFLGLTVEQMWTELLELRVEQMWTELLELRVEQMLLEVGLKQMLTDLMGQRLDKRKMRAVQRRVNQGTEQKLNDWMVKQMTVADWGV